MDKVLILIILITIIILCFKTSKENFSQHRKKIKRIDAKHYIYYGEVNKNDIPHGRGMKYYHNIVNPVVIDADFDNDVEKKVYSYLEGQLGEVKEGKNRIDNFQSFSFTENYPGSKGIKVYKNGSVYIGELKYIDDSPIPEPDGNGKLVTLDDIEYEGKWTNGILLFKNASNKTVKKVYKYYKTIVKDNDYLSPFYINYRGQKYYHRAHGAWIDSQEENISIIPRIVKNKKFN